MRTTVLTLAIGATLLAGCSGPAEAEPDATPSVPVRATVAAGGACRLLDHDRITRSLGLDLTVAGSAKQGKTNTCVARQADTPLPELSLSVTPTTADVAVFKDTIPPDGASTVTELGRAAYQAVRPAASGRGPYVEIGWLAGNARLMLLKVTLPKGGDSAGLAPKLVDLAREIDRAGI
ncbi:hypothetical protein [Catellatospora tritici]|uniref:hypothetical protein n=1 Tax=Catellatospora tritici TaxID=2851566 RepID=UPI001C2DE9FB|nr:hypothetical protein [Catellatospora tritici]MBV1848510.1 hypothetical protein [Catellatospora tritici]MBV1851470.1 hypothetical protein [Catellatospora tritici]